MRRHFLILLLLALAGGSIAACNHQTNGIHIKQMIPNTNKLVIKKQSGLKEQFEKIKEINDKESVAAVIDILRKAKWETAQVSMNHPPDLTINDNYELWITPEKNHLEVAIKGDSKYVMLPEKDSKLLYIIITDKNLGG